MSIQQLVEISNYYGANPDFVLAGGGNTSYKTDDLLYIKGSGTTLATITADGFVKMDRHALHRMWDTAYSEDEAEREKQVLADLMAARMNGEENKRPSVETSLHELFPHAFVVHTHPALINGITCARDGEMWCRRLFGGDMLWIPPTKPGYILAAAVRGEMAAYRERTGKDANRIMLANHGLFVAADSIEEIKEITTSIIHTIRPHIIREADMTPAEPAGNAASIGVIGAGKAVAFACNAEIVKLVESAEAFQPVSSLFTPDHMVYYGIPAFAESPSEMDPTNRLVAVKGLGVFAFEKDEKGAKTVIDLFNDSVKIAVYAENFGGGAFMPDWLIEFIANWEAETYRKSVHQ